MAVERELERLELELDRVELEQDPRAHEKVRCLRFFFVFFCLFCLKKICCATLLEHQRYSRVAQRCSSTSATAALLQRCVTLLEH